MSVKGTLPGNRRRARLVIALFIFLPFGYLGYTIGLMITEGAIFAPDWFSTFAGYLTTPLPVIMNRTVLSCIMTGFVISIIIWVTYINSVNSRMPGQEYGTARMDAPEIISKKLADGNGNNKILGERLRISTNDRKTGINNNMIVLGGSGTGKSFRLVKPNILAGIGSMIMTDPKGELLRDCGNYLLVNKYKVKTLDLINMEHSYHYNPISYIRRPEDVVRLVTIIIKNTTPKNASTSDPFWEKSESLFLQSLIFYVWLVPEMEGQRNFPSVLKLLKEARVSEKENVQSDLDKRMAALLKREWSYPKEAAEAPGQLYPGSEHPAFVSYRMVREGAVDTVKSVIISANSRLGFMLNSPALMELLSYDEMELTALGTGYEGSLKKTALFCVIPDQDKTYNAVVGMLYSQTFQELYRAADSRDNGRLPIPVSFWLDEFANVALPEDFLSLISTMRSRGISANIFLQNISQLKAMYKDSWETLTGNSDTLVYLGGNEQSTHKYISDLLGKWTIEKRASSSPVGTTGNASYNDDVIGRELMTTEEVRMLSRNKEIVLIRGEYPTIDNTYKTERSAQFLQAGELGPCTYKDYRPEETDATRPQSVQILTQEEAQYEMAAANAEIIKTSLSQLRRIRASKQDAKKEIVASDSDLLAYLAACQSLSKEKSEPTQEETNAEKTHADPAPEETIQSRMAQYAFTDDQLAEAVFATSDGLSEQLILEWFLPENSPKKMELARKLQLQNMPSKSGLSR